MEVVGVRAVIEGLQQYVSGARQVETSTAGMGRSADALAGRSSGMGVFGKALGGVATIASGFIVGKGLMALPGFLSGAANAAAEDAAGQAKLQRAIENTGQAYSGYADKIKATIDVAQKRGFTDDQARDSLSILTAQTDDANEALRRFSIAQDLARGADIDVVTASRLLGKVTDENVSVLNRYGISIKKGASEAELFAAVQRKFAGQAEDFAKSPAGQAAAARIAFAEFKESIGYLVLPIMTALAKLMNTTVIPALNRMVQILGPILQLQARRLSQTFRDSGIVAFVKDFGAAVQVLGQYLRFVAADDDLLNDFLASLPAQVRPVAVALGIVVVILEEVGRQLVAVARFGGDMLRFLRDLASRFERVTPGGKQFADQLIRIGGQEGLIRKIAAAITALVAALAVKALIDFAVGLGAMAFQFATFPLRAAVDAARAVADFAKAAAGLVSKVVSVTVNAVGTAIDFVRGLIDGAMQRLIDATPGLRVKVEPQIAVQPEVAVGAGSEAGQGFLSGFSRTIGSFAAGIAGGAIGTVFGNIFADPNLHFRSVFGYLTGIAVAMRALGGRLLSNSVAIAIGDAFRAAGTGMRVAMGASLVAILISAVEIAFDLAVGDFRKGGIRAGGVIGGGIVGGILGAFAGGVGAVPGAIIGAAIGGALADLFLIFERQITSFVKAVPGLLSGLPGMIGEVLGRGAATAIAFPILLIAYIVRGLARVIPRLTSALIQVGREALTALADAIVQAAPLILRAFSYVLDPRQGVIDLAKFLMEQIALTISDPRRLLRGLQQLGAALVVGFRELARLSIDAFDIGFGRLADVARKVFGAIEGALGDFTGRFVSGFRDQWREIDRISDGGLSQIFTGVQDFVGNVISAFGQIGPGIATAFAGVVSAVSGAFNGIRNVIESAISFVANQVADFIQTVKDALDALPGRNPAGDALQAAIDALRQAAQADTGPAGGQANPGSQVPVGFPHLASGTPGFRFPTLALFGEHGPELGYLPPGMGVVPADQTRGIMAALASLVPGRGSPTTNAFSLTIPIAVQVADMDWGTISRRVHLEIDRAFTSARSRSTRAGAPISSSIG